MIDVSLSIITIRLHADEGNRIDAGYLETFGKRPLLPNPCVRLKF